MGAKTASERQQASRDRRRAAGLAKVEAWVHRDDRDRLRAYVRKLNRARGA